MEKEKVQLSEEEILLLKHHIIVDLQKYIVVNGVVKLIIPQWRVDAMEKFNKLPWYKKWFAPYWKNPHIGNLYE